MSAATPPDWVALDWGTTNMRAWAMSADDKVQARAESPRGMGSLAPDQFEDALMQTIGPWLDESRTTQIIACGMVGARQGWVEAAYNATPTAPVTGKATLAPTTNTSIAVSIIPGVCQNAPADVMRGEETQIAGYVAAKSGDGIVCLPGTHCKWVELREGEITGFHTEMTGEIFALLASQSVLRHSLAGEDWDEAAFDAGVSEALQAASPLSQLFGIRAGSLLHGLGADAARARLSGLLIGGEIAGQAQRIADRPVALIGTKKLSELYARAIALAGGETVLLNAEEMTLAGLVAARRFWETR